ncbi:FecR domain-containing protein [Blastomonas sp.]|uniref:FecR domain-containing protein n=1 Tax=Blastomonas sp. TaxID=1909299 RepID=UPI00261E3811|nr:FecR domain-containing protein [Blastomonas sp.]MDM7958080.1 FecR domain-containing protein [Blastomonas sp.]
MTLRASLTCCLLAVAALFTGLALAPQSALAQQPGNAETIVYTVRKGDTLISLGRSWLIRESDWKQVQRLNRVANPHRLPVASRLTLPVRLLRFRPASATVAAFRGDARAAMANRTLESVTMGQSLGEGARFVTGPASSLSLALSDGSVVTLPSNSALRITRLRKLLITDSIDYELALDSGGVRSRVSPLRNRDDRFRLRNPIAVSAVRGTDFRNHYDAALGQARAELIEGGLAVNASTGPGETRLAAEFGAVIGKAGGISVEKLLPPPTLVTGGGKQRAPVLAFSVASIAEAQGYRLQIARDSGFVDVVDDLTSPAPDFTAAALPNGNYFARFTAIAASGLEGMPGTFTFKRRLATATQGAAAGEDGYVFRWVGSGEGERRYHFQLRTQDSPIFVVDETGLTGSSVILGDLPPGRYMWRVGTTTFAADETDIDWSDYESFTIDE